MKRIPLFVLVGLMAVSCGRNLNKDVEAAMDKYDAMILGKDVNGIALMFAEDGEMAAPGMASVYGRDNIRQFLEQFSGVQVLKQQSITDSIVWNADTAIQYGTYYQRARVNEREIEVRGMFQADWITQPGGELMLQRMSAWPVNQ